MGKGGKDSDPSVSFTINGEEYTVDGSSPNLSPETRLVDFIRDIAQLKGTKVMCREGGCGACVVTVRRTDAASGEQTITAVNSCLTPLVSCGGWDISTVEDLGNKRDGYGIIQKRLASFHGSQCGFCSSGMVLNMNSLMESKKAQNLPLLAEEVEKSFDGNICRCTGFRPILDAFKSLADDAPPNLKCPDDIEDCASCPCPMRRGQGQYGCGKSAGTLCLANGSLWTTATELSTLFEVMKKYKLEGRKYRFVAGNTASGVYKNESNIPFGAYIEINSVAELKLKKLSEDENEVILGGSVTLTNTIEYLEQTSKLNKGFGYLAEFSKHLERVANVPVRNIWNGSIAGNLMIKHAHNDFPSDVFVLLETIGAKLLIASESSKTEQSLVEPSDFLRMDMEGKLLLSIHFPKRDESYHFRSFKITPRHQNAHAYLNAGFLFKLDTSKKLAEKPRIVFGGISPKFIHATATEQFLEKNPDIGNSSVVQKALKILEAEVEPFLEYHPPEGSILYKKNLATSLLYKAILGFLPESGLPKTLLSGSCDIPRLTSKGRQVYETEKSDSPLYKPVPKMEAKWQTSGEAEYVGDIPKRPDELFAAFVESTIGCGKLASIDPSAALKLPGVVRFFSAQDIPGQNNYMVFNWSPPRVVEPVFASDQISFHGQSLGLIVAKTREAAIAGAKAVVVTYSEIKKPVVDMAEPYTRALEAGTLDKHIIFGTFSTQPDKNVVIEHSVKGEIRTGSQYHFYIEPQNVLTIPKEDGLDIYLPTQWMDHAQNTVAAVLGIPASSINIEVRRLGGGFGGKSSRPSLLAAASALAASTLRKPIRMVLDLETCMSMMGKRCPYIMTYEVGFDSAGRIGNLKTDLYCDAGFSPNDASLFVALLHLQNVYKAVGWEVRGGVFTTNTASNTFTRAPGSVQATALIENVFEHVAHTLKKDPMEVRLKNLLHRGDAILPTLFGPKNQKHENLIQRMFEEIKVTGEYEERKAAVELFNKENRWKKRGLSMVPVRYPVEFVWGSNIPTMISIYHFDGTVACTHGGIEMGQGLNTKVLQTIAQSFQIPMDTIKIKPSNNFIGANGFGTNGSLASEICCFAALRACEKIKERLKPVLEKLENPSWEKLIAAAHAQKIDLTASYTPGPSDNLEGYDVWVLALSEAEIDVLTGEYKIVRTDIIEDAGKSLSPVVDIGQIEGGYMFTQGLFTTEKIFYSGETGELLTNRTWNYKPALPKDIPEDLRITLLSNVPNPHGILRSKATGEPVSCASVVVYFAIKNAILAARAEKGVHDWFQLDAPVSPEDIHKHCLTKPEDFVF